MEFLYRRRHAQARRIQHVRSHIGPCRSRGRRNFNAGQAVHFPVDLDGSLFRDGVVLKGLDKVGHQIQIIQIVDEPSAHNAIIVYHAGIQIIMDEIRPVAARQIGGQSVRVDDLPFDVDPGHFGNLVPHQTVASGRGVLSNHQARHGNGLLHDWISAGFRRSCFRCGLLRSGRLLPGRGLRSGFLRFRRGRSRRSGLSSGLSACAKGQNHGRRQDQ